MTSPRRLTIPDIAAEPELAMRLIAERETLCVERKENDPKIGLGATVASFANMLGGWLLIGVGDEGSVVGYEPRGTADLQDYIGDVAVAGRSAAAVRRAYRARGGRSASAWCTSLSRATRPISPARA